MLQCLQDRAQKVHCQDQINKQHKQPEYEQRPTLGGRQEIVPQGLATGRIETADAHGVPDISTCIPCILAVLITGVLQNEVAT
jgi:hypothetical protein